MIDRKQVHEREVFLEFANAANLSLDAATIDVRQPPEPDIRCRLDGKSTYYELGRLLSDGMQRLRLQALKRAPNQIRIDPSVQLPEQEMLTKKLANNYDTAGAPVELLLYYDNENALVGDVPVFGDDEYAGHATAVMAALSDASNRVFRRVWVYERHRRRVLWCYPPV